LLQSNGVLVKSTTTIWEGTPAQFPGWAELGLNGRWSSYAELYRSQLWVNVVIDKRAKAAARLPYKVYERGTDGRLDAGDSPFGRLMAKPSRHVDPFLFWLWTVATRDIHGEAFWLKDRDRGGRPVSLLPVHPTKVYIDEDGKWKIRLKDGDVTVQRRDLVHFKEFNPDTLLRGMSKLEPLRATLENEDGARRANHALWTNGGRPSTLLQHPGKLTDNVANRLAAQWSQIHGGVDNWAKAAVLEEGMTAAFVPLNVEELQYIEGRKLNREEVCAAFDMAPPVVHILDRATFSNIVEQHRSMYRDTMGPLLGSLEATVDAELRDGTYGADVAPDFGDRFYGEFLLDEVLRGDFEARQTAYLQANYMTIAEKREKENLPFIEGTEHIMLNSATLPLGEDGMLVQPTATNDGTASPEEIALMLQKIYLAVGVVITPEEARALVNQAGGNLTGPAPTPSQLALPPAPQRSFVEVGESGPELVIGRKVAGGIATWLKAGGTASCERDIPELVKTVMTIPSHDYRSLMGRLGRVSSLAEIGRNPEPLIKGMDDTLGVAVLQQLVLAQLHGETLEAFKSRFAPRKET
jgi:HK97 family phage portal protein